jgi:hypothetical protein
MHLVVRRLSATLATLAVLLAADPARACSCMEVDVPTAFGQVDAVFEGRVLEIDRSGGSLRVTLAVVQHWKGIGTERVVVETAADSAACGVAFEVETSWLVYAEREGELLRASLCSRTARIEEAQADLAELGAGVVPVEIGPSDGVEEEEPDEPPARGGCASCSTSKSGALDRGAIAASIGLGLVVATRRRRARARSQAARDRPRAAPAP